MDETELIYLYDGTLEGMLTAVFEAFRRKERPRNISCEEGLQHSLLGSYIPIATELGKAERVRDGIIGALGERSYEAVKQAFLSEDGEKGGILLRYLLHTMPTRRGVSAHDRAAPPRAARPASDGYASAHGASKAPTSDGYANAAARPRPDGSAPAHGASKAPTSDGYANAAAASASARPTRSVANRACGDLAHPAVNDFEALCARVSREVHYMLQFVRFAQLEGGVYFSRIEPKASVVPLIMGHFAARFNIQPFMIYDARHGMSGVFDTERWWIVDARDMRLPSPDVAEEEFQSLWQTFYDTIAIAERRNPRCQRGFMPKRFWGNLCEQVPPQLRRHRPQDANATPTEVARRLPSSGPHVHTAEVRYDGQLQFGRTATAGVRALELPSVQLG